MKTKQHGFTLAEVLVALALLALLATMAWRGVASMAEAKQSADARVNETLRLGTVLAQWEQDLLQVQDPRVLPDALAFDGKSLRLVRRNAGGLQVVVWALNETRWQRWASPVTNSSCTSARRSVGAATRSGPTYSRNSPAGRRRVLVTSTSVHCSPSKRSSSGSPGGRRVESAPGVTMHCCSRIARETRDDRSRSSSRVLLILDAPLAGQ